MKRTNLTIEDFAPQIENGMRRTTITSAFKTVKPYSKIVLVQQSTSHPSNTFDVTVCYPNGKPRQNTQGRYLLNWTYDYYNIRDGKITGHSKTNDWDVAIESLVDRYVKPEYKRNYQITHAFGYINQSLKARSLKPTRKIIDYEKRERNAYKSQWKASEKYDIEHPRMQSAAKRWANTLDDKTNKFIRDLKNGHGEFKGRSTVPKKQSLSQKLDKNFRKMVY